MKRRSMRSLTLAVGIFASLAGLAFAAEVPQSAPTAAPIASGPTPQLAGSSTCRECHAPFYGKWATSCHGCHVSQFSSNYDPQADAYHSEWAEPGISCETCHAGGGEHVNLFRSLPAGQKPDDIRIISTKKLSVEQLNAMCAPCHAKSMPLTSSFRPGDRYFDNYDLAGPEHCDFYPDGRDLDENFKSPNACNVCHTDKDAAWSDRYVRQWRLRDYQGPVLHIAGLVAAARQHDWTRLPEMLAYIANANRPQLPSPLVLLHPARKRWRHKDSWATGSAPMGATSFVSVQLIRPGMWKRLTSIRVRSMSREQAHPQWETQSSYSSSCRTRGIRGARMI